MRDTVTIYVPEGYKNPREFLNDCGFESLSVGPENVAAFNDGYAAGLEDRDEKLPRAACSHAANEAKIEALEKALRQVRDFPYIGEKAAQQMVLIARAALTSAGEK